MTDRPNVLVVVFDTARADALEPYGATAGASPAVAQLAARGAALPAVFSTAPWTLPSHTSMFTGVHARELGLGQAPRANLLAVKPVIEANEPRLLPAVLRRSGYRTQAVSTNVWVSDATGFSTGFDDFVDVHSPRSMTLEQRGPRALLRAAREAVAARVDDGAAAAGDQLGRWIDDWSGDPAFWFVNLTECHSPYMPPEPYNDYGFVNRLRLMREARRHLTLGSVWRTCIGPFDVSDEALERMRHMYAQSIRYMDDWLARILERLDAKGILDETLVIVTADHGENFGEGGLLAHAYSLDNRLTRVPFVAAGAGVQPAEGVYSLADLPAILADVVGLADSPWPLRDGAGEVAIAQFDPPQHPSDPTAAEKALAEWGLDKDDEARFLLEAEQTSATDGRHKLVLTGGREQLFDLEADPLELSSLPSDHAGSAGARARLRTALADPRLLTRVEASAQGVVAIDDEESKRIEQQLKLLGYL